MFKVLFTVLGLGSISAFGESVLVPIATPPSSLTDVINFIEKGKAKPQKYVARPVLSTKDTKQLKGKLKSVLVPLRQEKSLVPTFVDLRSMDSAIRNQKNEGLCTSFATSSAIEFGSPKENLSERHLWSLYQVYYTDSAVRAAAKYYVAKEAAWPYSYSSAVAPLVGRGKIGTYHIAANMSEVYTALQSKKAVVLSVETNTSWSNPYKGVLTVAGTKQGGHAIKVSGFFDTTNGRYLIIKNSWGAAYGDKGYVYMPESYCSKYWCSFHIIDGVLYK
jgi:C1A family cysteine protease